MWLISRRRCAPWLILWDQSIRSAGRLPQRLFRWFDALFAGAEEILPSSVVKSA